MNQGITNSQCSLSVGFYRSPVDKCTYVRLAWSPTVNVFIRRGFRMQRIWAREFNWLGADPELVAQGHSGRGQNRFEAFPIYRQVIGEDKFVHA